MDRQTDRDRQRQRQRQTETDRDRQTKWRGNREPDRQSIETEI